MKIYFSGINGFGIGPLALIAKTAGYEVEGSDLAAGPMSQAVKQSGIKVYDKQDGSGISASHKRAPIDWLVVSSALPPEHPEIAFAQDQGIKISKRDALLNKIIREKQLRLIAVAGTHGKTTTTGILIYAFKYLGIPVSYSIGTILPWGPSGLFAPGSQYFIYEADEFDRNFLHFKPYASIITTIDYDHPDTYPTVTEYQEAFTEFVLKSHCAFLWRGDADRLGRLVSGALHVYGSDTLTNQFKLIGEHNRRNAFLAAALLQAILPRQKTGNLEAAINGFPGTGRRFERLSRNVYSDYAHHPREIAATIEMAKELGKPIVVIYQPHQNVRQHKLKQAYAHVFDEASKVYWLETYLSREDPKLRLLKPATLIKYANTAGNIEAASMNRQLADKIIRYAKEGYTVILMSAGSLDAWARRTLT